MEFSGDSSAWRGIIDLVPDILQLVCDTWKKVAGVKPTDYEVSITKRFLIPLRKAKNDDDLPLRIYPELSVFDNDIGEEQGRIDLQFIPINSSDENVYFAFECKRLRIPSSSGVRSNAGEYVGDDGMMCFITGKYSLGHPAGGMIGYVMDGHLDPAIEAVRSAIERRRNELRILSGSGLDTCSHLPDRTEVRQTRHALHCQALTLHHLFLAV